MACSGDAAADSVVADAADVIAKSTYRSLQVFMWVLVQQKQLLQYGHKQHFIEHKMHHNSSK